RRRHHRLHRVVTTSLGIFATSAVMACGLTVPAAHASARRARAAVRVAAIPAGPFSVDTSHREDVRQLWYRAHETPNVDSGWNGNVSSCTPGTLSQDYLDTTLARVNYFRTMA